MLINVTYNNGETSTIQPEAGTEKTVLNFFKALWEKGNILDVSHVKL